MKTPKINLTPSHLCAHTCFCTQVNTHKDKHALSTHAYPNAFTKTTNELCNQHCHRIKVTLQKPVSLTVAFKTIQHSKVNLAKYIQRTLELKIFCFYIKIVRCFGWTVHPKLFHKFNLIKNISEDIKTLK